MYFLLGLSPFKWPGLKALPTVAPTSDSAAFRGAVRSLIAVLDAELAASLPAPSPGSKYPVSPKAGKLNTPDELWDGLMESSDEEGEEDEELKKDKLWERHLEEQQERRERHHTTIPNSTTTIDATIASTTSPKAREAQKQALKDLQEISASPRAASGDAPFRQLSAECAELVKQLDKQLLLESIEDEVPQEPTPEEGSSKELESELSLSIEKSGSTMPSSTNNDPNKPRKPKKTKYISRKPSGFTGQVSPIAIAALWELLQCCIGASAAAGESAKAAVAEECDQGEGILHPSSSPKFLKRQGPPPCVRWYDARARVALALVSLWLQVPPRKLATLEVLLGSDKAPTTVRLRESNAVTDRYRYLKVGLAAVGGGALFAVTGGLAAPAIAAGVGSLLGIVPGAGAAAGAVAGFMSTQVGVAAVTTTMATAGAATTGSKMAYRTADVKDFGFLEVCETMAPAALANGRSPHRTLSSQQAQQARTSSSGQNLQNDFCYISSREDSGDRGHLTLESSPGPIIGGGSGGIGGGAHVPMGSSSGLRRSYRGRSGSGSGSAASLGGSNSMQSLSGPTEEGSLSTTTPAWKNWFGKKGGTEEESVNALLPSPVRPSHPAEGIKLSTVIGVSGWVSSPEDFINPWKSLKTPASDKFALVWCTSELQALNRALAALLTKGAAGQAASLGMQHLLVGAAGLVTALGPTVILGAATGLLIENAWTVAIDRADKAGKLLAHVLMSGGCGGRPVTLVAHSMGARLVFSALLELCRCGARGLVQDVVLLGAPVPPASERWRMARRVVAGRLVNGYSRRDWLLSVMFWQGIAKPAAGLAPVEVDGIENVSLSSVVGGHFDYIGGLDEILDLLQLTLN